MAGLKHTVQGVSVYLAVVLVCLQWTCPTLAQYAKSSYYMDATSDCYISGYLLIKTDGVVNVFSRKPGSGISSELSCTVRFKPEDDRDFMEMSFTHMTISDKDVTLRVDLTGAMSYTLSRGSAIPDKMQSTGGIATVSLIRLSLQDSDYSFGVILRAYKEAKTVSGDDQKPAAVGLVVGIVVGILGLLVLIAILVVCCYRRKRRQLRADDSKADLTSSSHVSPKFGLDNAATQNGNYLPRKRGEKEAGLLPAQNRPVTSQRPPLYESQSDTEYDSMSDGSVKKLNSSPMKPGSVMRYEDERDNNTYDNQAEPRRKEPLQSVERNQAALRRNQELLESIKRENPLGDQAGLRRSQELLESIKKENPLGAQAGLRKSQELLESIEKENPLGAQAGLSRKEDVMESIERREGSQPAKQLPSKSPLISDLRSNPRFLASFRASQREAEEREQKISGKVEEKDDSGSESDVSMTMTWNTTFDTNFDDDPRPPAGSFIKPPSLPPVPMSPHEPVRRENIASIHRAPRLSASSSDMEHPHTGEGPMSFSLAGEARPAPMQPLSFNPAGGARPAPVQPLGEIVPIRVQNPHSNTIKQRAEARHALWPDAEESYSTSADSQISEPFRPKAMPPKAAPGKTSPKQDKPSAERQPKKPAGSKNENEDRLRPQQAKNNLREIVTEVRNQEAKNNPREARSEVRNRPQEVKNNPREVWSEVKNRPKEVINNSREAGSEVRNRPQEVKNNPRETGSEMGSQPPEMKNNPREARSEMRSQPPEVRNNPREAGSEVRNRPQEVKNNPREAGSEVRSQPPEVRNNPRETGSEVRSRPQEVKNNPREAGSEVRSRPQEVKNNPREAGSEVRNQPQEVKNNPRETGSEVRNRPQEVKNNSREARSEVRNREVKSTHKGDGLEYEGRFRKSDSVRKSKTKSPRIGRSRSAGTDLDSSEPNTVPRVKTDDYEDSDVESRYSGRFRKSDSVRKSKTKSPRIGRSRSAGTDLDSSDPYFVPQVTTDDYEDSDMGSRYSGRFRKSDSARKSKSKSPGIGRSRSTGNSLEDADSIGGPVTARGYQAVPQVTADDYEDSDAESNYNPLRRTGSKNSLYASRSSLYARRRQQNSAGGSVYSFATQDDLDFERRDRDNFKERSLSRRGDRNSRSLGDLELELRDQQTRSTQTLQESATQTGIGFVNVSHGKQMVRKRSKPRNLSSSQTQTAKSKSHKLDSSSSSSGVFRPRERKNSASSVGSSRSKSKDRASSVSSVTGDKGKQHKSQHGWQDRRGGDRPKAKSTAWQGPASTVGDDLESFGTFMTGPVDQSSTVGAGAPQQTVPGQGIYPHQNFPMGIPAAAAFPGHMAFYTQATQPPTMATYPQMGTVPQHTILTNPTSAAVSVPTATTVTHPATKPSKWDMLCQMTGGDTSKAGGGDFSDSASVSGPVFSNTYTGHPFPTQSYPESHYTVSERGGPARPVIAQTQGLDYARTRSVTNQSQGSRFAGRSAWEALKVLTDQSESHI